MNEAGKAAPDVASLRAAYRQHNAGQLTRSLIVANLIAMVGMPAGAVLDYFLYPAKFGQFLAIRLGVDIVLLAIIGIMLVGRARPSLTKAKIFGVLSGVLINGSFCVMIALTEGAKSPYFAGLVLVTLVWAALLPWSVIETLIVCALSIILYGAACVVNPTFSIAPPIALIGFGISFLNIATIVAVGTSLFSSRSRFEDFRLRHQLDAQNRELQDLDRIKTQFFSNVSHELRTPLTLILSPVENLLAHGDALDKRVHESLILVHRNSLRLLKLINDLLDLTRVDQGGDTLRRKTFPLAPYVKGIVDSVRHLGLSKHLRMQVEEGGPSLDLSADPTRLEKVLVNLLTNAIKYTPAGGTITVRWRQAGGDVVIEVQDTGVGIPPEDIGKIFDRFHQVRSNTANQVQGVGIGLALVKELVEQHGGRIDVESAPGRGSTFRVTLPPAGAEPAAEAFAEPAGPAVADEPFEKAFRSADRVLRSFGDDVSSDLPVVGKGNEVVLVADDENDMREFVVALLAEDYRVVQTRHGGNVAELVAEHEPGLVLLDWMMPGKDGLAVCRELRADASRRDLKIMLLTARIDEKSKLEALGAGADDFLTKPFSSVEVKMRVANLLRSARLQKDLRARNEELSATIEKLRSTEFRLIQSEKMNAIGSLSAGLLHEINNPLNYTMTAISLVNRQRDSLSEDMRDLMADIQEGMNRVRDVITHLRNFAYPERADQMAVFPLGEAVRDARKLAAKELMEVQVDVDLPDDLLVHGQRTQLTHVFINLFSNAARAFEELPSGRPRVVSIRAKVEDEMATLEVADSGPGIPTDILHRVFEPFFTTRDVGSGMGMGLSICQTIMESHDGSIRVGNRPEGGAVFTLHIPLAAKALKSC